MKRTILFFLCLLIVTQGYTHDPLIPECDYTPTAIDGLLYKLNEIAHTAMVANGNSWEGELNIPEQVTYNGETYTVNKIEWLAFDFCETLTKVKIPKTIETIKHYAGQEDFKNPFRGCTSLKRIEVDENNPNMCSINGILFSKDKTQLFCYPGGARSETYTVPESVTWIGSDAFALNPYLVNVTMPNSVTHLPFGVFFHCKSLKTVVLSENISYIGASCFEKCESLLFLDIPESVIYFEEGIFRWTPIKTLIIRGSSFPYGLRYDTFSFMDDGAVLYVQESEVKKFGQVFPGTVLPLEEYKKDGSNAGVNYIKFSPLHDAVIFDLPGRRLTDTPLRGMYIRDGKKYVVK